MMNAIRDAAEIGSRDRLQRERNLQVKGGGLYAVLEQSFALAAQEGRHALLQRERRLLAEGGDLHAALLQGRVGCREIAAQHGITVRHLRDLALVAATSRVRTGENLVDVLQTLDLDTDGWIEVNNIVLENARAALRDGERASRVIERLGIHDRDGITKLIRERVGQLRAEGANTVPDIMQKLDFQDPRYARLALKCVEGLVGQAR